MKFSFDAEGKNTAEGILVEKKLGNSEVAYAPVPAEGGQEKEKKDDRKVRRVERPLFGEGQRDRKKKRKFKWWMIPVILLIVLFAVVGVYGGKIMGMLKNMGLDWNIGSVGTLLFGSDEYQLKSDNGRTNFLLVGIDTRPNSGLMNTDTIMIVSLEHETGHVSLISIPRDTQAKYTVKGQNYTTKINGVYFRAKQAGGEEAGMNLLREVVTEMTGLPIHFAAMVNYYAFVDAVDEVGGLEVCVERSFSARYPKPGDEIGESVSGKEITVHFEEGCQFMDGERALIYARARKSNSAEGSDYARAARQQIVMQAFYEKFRSTSWFSQYDNALAFLDILGNNVKIYSVEPEDIKAAWEMREKVNTSDTTNVVLSPAVDYYRLIKASGNYNNEPVADDWGEVNGYIAFLLGNPEVYEEAPKIGVYDGGAGKSATNDVVDMLNNGYLYARYKGVANVQECSTSQVGLVSTENPKNASLLYVQQLYKAEILTELPVSAKGVDLVLIVCDTSE